MKFDFKEKYILENEIVRLQPLEISDFDFLLEYSENEAEIWKFNSNGANGKENLKKYIANAVKNREYEKDYPFIVFDKIENKYVGSTRFYEVQLLNKTLDLGFTWYGKKSQGTGINKNCKYLMLEFAFEKMEMERVGFGANSKNERSINAMKSIGCVVEGIFRNYSTNANGERIDAIKLSILKTEWNESVKNNLKKQTTNFASR
jgi:N-acetyltransferase